MVKCSDDLVLTGCTPALSPCERTDRVFRHDHLSVSRVRSYVACPRAFYYHYIAHAEPRPSGKEAAIFGTVVHAASENVSRWILANEFQGVVPVDTVRAELVKGWRDEGATLAENLFGEAMEMLRTYYARPVDAWSIVDVEREVHFQAGRFDVLGYVDRIEWASPNVLEVIDLKTSRLLYDTDDLEKDLQACLYTSAAKDIAPAKEIGFRFDMMRFGTSQRHKPVTDDMVLDALAYVEAIGEMTERLSTREDQFPGKLQPNCAYCDFVDICDVYQRAMRAPPTEKRHLTVLANEELVADRVRIAMVAKAAYAEQKAIDDVLKKRVAEDGDILAAGHRVKVSTTNDRLVDVERLRKILSSSGRNVPSSLFSVSLSELDKILETMTDEILKAEIRSCITTAEGSKRIDVRAISKR